MRLPDFRLERYLAQYEFQAPYLLCCSDCESLTVKDLLDLEGGDARQAWENLWLGYTESQGHPELRHLIAGLYRNCRENQVLVTSGAEEAIFLFMNGVLQGGDHVIVQHPCYQSLEEIPRVLGCEVSRWEMGEEDGWDLDLGALERRIKGNTRLVVVNFPHNPTGFLLSAPKWEALIKIVRSRGLLLLSDEVYRSLEYEAGRRLTAASDLYENAVSLGVMSKSYGLAGLRIGWAVTRNSEVLRQMASLKDYTSICNSAPSEFLAAVALKHGEQLIGRNLGIIRKNLEVLDEFFSRFGSQVTWSRPQAGPVAFPRLRGEAEVEDFCRDLLKAHGVLLLPGIHFDWGNKHFRLGLGRRDMPQCLKKLEEYLRERQ